MTKRFYYSSDYAGIEATNASFYYGYEETKNDEWCFVAEFNDTKITIPFSELEAKNEYEVVDCLMAGIAYILSKYRIGEKNEI